MCYSFQKKSSDAVGGSVVPHSPEDEEAGLRVPKVRQLALAQN
jgi:hypothetical protein